MLRNQFGRTQWNSQMTCVILNLALVHLETMLVSVQDRCIVCCLMQHSLRNHFGRTIWYSLVKRLKWKLGLVSLQIVLILMQGSCMVCMERTICSEINLDAPDGTPRLVSYGISLPSVQRQCQFWCKIGARFAPNTPQDKKPFWTHPMVLLG